MMIPVNFYKSAMVGGEVSAIAFFNLGGANK